MRKLLTILLASLLALAAPAAAQERPPARDPSVADGSAQRALDAARARWAAAGIRDYDFTFEESCFCPNRGAQPNVVRGGAAVEGRTVEQVFATVQETIDSRPDRFAATYGESGVPTWMSVDHTEMAIDDEYAFNVSDFRQVGPGSPAPPTPVPPPPPAKSELAQARAAWKAAGIRAHSIVVSRRCGAARSVRRDRTVPWLHRLIGRTAGAEVRYGRLGIPRSVSTGRCTYVVTRFRRGR
jgi:hypothetical protein